MSYRNECGYRCAYCPNEKVQLKIIPYDGKTGTGEPVCLRALFCRDGRESAFVCCTRIKPVLMAAVTPGEPMRIIRETEAKEYLPFFEEDDEISEVSGVNLVMSYGKEQIIQIDGRYYLNGPCLIYDLDDDGRTVSLSGEKIYTVQELVRKRTVPARQDGEEKPVLALN